MNGISKLTLIFSILLLSLCSSDQVQGSTKPNVVILYADDMGYGDISSQNSKSKIQTPHLDKLASQGIRFTDGHSSSGICTPSRYAMLTGRYHWRKFHGIVGVFGKSVFDPDRLTLPEMLQGKGYDTACIGKWHLGWDWDIIRTSQPNKNGKYSNHFSEFDWSKSIPDGPLAHGFDHYFGDTVINFPPYAWIQDEKLVSAPDTMMDSKLWKPIKEGRWECRPGPMVSDWDPYQVFPILTQKSEEFILKRKGNDKPFFLYFPFPCPHAPIIPTDEFDGRSHAGPYGDFIVQTDETVGRILKAIKQAGHEENTIVIFTADNGPEGYAYARSEKFNHWSAEPFRGLKRDIYEGGHHVPFLMKWPARISKNKTSHALISQIDIMATLARILDVDLPENAAEDSVDLTPLFENEKTQVRTQHVHNTYANKFGLRSGKWILIKSKNGYTSRKSAQWEESRNYPKDDDQEVELYDFSADPGQKFNVSKENPQIVARLLKELEIIQSDTKR